MSDHEGDGGVEEAALSQAEIQHIVAESVAAALRPRGEDVPTPRVYSLPSDPQAPSDCHLAGRKVGGLRPGVGGGRGVRGPYGRW